MKNIVIVLVLFAIVAAIIRYFIRAKKRGKTCVGCPYANQCGDKCSVAKAANSERN